MATTITRPVVDDRTIATVDVTDDGHVSIDVGLFDFTVAEARDIASTILAYAIEAERYLAEQTEADQ